MAAISFSPPSTAQWPSPAVTLVNFHSQFRPFSRFLGFIFMVLLFICQWNISILTEEGPLLAGGKMLPLPRVESDRQLVAAAARRSSAPVREAQWRPVCPLPRPRALVSGVKRSIGFTITEKAPTRAFSWLKAATTAFTFKTL